MTPKRRLGILGFGHLGKYLYEKLPRDEYEVVFVWNRNLEVLDGQVPKELVLDTLEDAGGRGADLIIEVAHPEVTKRHGRKFVAEADYLIGSPTALSDPDLRKDLERGRHGVYVPAGALWGAQDINKMERGGAIQALRVTMAKHPDSLKVVGELKDIKDTATKDKVVLYDGPVDALCKLAPNNVNTMAAAAIAAPSLGFHKTQGCLVADPSLEDWHEVQVEVWGHPDSHGRQFHCSTLRRNPAPRGQVTGTATYGSFLASLKGAEGKGPGIHLC